MPNSPEQGFGGQLCIDQRIQCTYLSSHLSTRLDSPHTESRHNFAIPLENAVLVVEI